MKVIKNTPVEVYTGGNGIVFVKREDLCAPEGAPPFSKIRGIVRRLRKLKREGVKVVGYVETSISMAGWGLCWAANLIGGIKVVIFDPIYKTKQETLDFHREQWKKFKNIEIIPIKAGMAKVNFYIGKRILQKEYPDGVLLPLGLPFYETIEETKREFETTKRVIRRRYRERIKTVVSCVGSGTIFAGLISGVSNDRFESFRGVNTRYTRYLEAQKINIIKKSLLTGEEFHGFLNKKRKPGGGLKRSTKKVDFDIIDLGYDYTQPAVGIDCPFPCNPYYDLKAYKWMQENIELLERPILFWNIGS
jgi:hypothetical protein